MQRAVDGLITLLTKVCRPVSRCLSVVLEPGELFPISLIHKFQTSEKISVAAQKMSKSGFFWNDRKSRFSLTVKQRFKKFHADHNRRSIQKLNEMIESQRRQIYRALQGDEQHRRDQHVPHEHLLEQNRNLREAHEKSLSEMEELKRFQGSTFDTMSRRRLIEYRDTILELTGKIQELQNEINCMNNSRDFKDGESVRSGQSHVTSQPVFFPPHPIPEGMLRHSFITPSRKNGPPSIWDTHGISGNVFANPTASSSAPYPQ